MKTPAFVLSTGNKVSREPGTKSPGSSVILLTQANAGGYFVVGNAGFVNEPTRFLGLGGEVSGRYTPVDGIDLGANYVTSAYGRIRRMAKEVGADRGTSNDHDPDAARRS